MSIEQVIFDTNNETHRAGRMWCTYGTHRLQEWRPANGHAIWLLAHRSLEERIAAGRNPHSSPDRNLSEERRPRRRDRGEALRIKVDQYVDNERRTIPRNYQPPFGAVGERILAPITRGRVYNVLQRLAAANAWRYPRTKRSDTPPAAGGMLLNVYGIAAAKKTR